MASHKVKSPTHNCGACGRAIAEPLVYTGPDITKSFIRREGNYEQRYIQMGCPHCHTLVYLPYGPRVTPGVLQGSRGIRRKRPY